MISLPPRSGDESRWAGLLSCQSALLSCLCRRPVWVQAGAEWTRLFSPAILPASAVATAFALPVSSVAVEPAHSGLCSRLPAARPRPGTHHPVRQPMLGRRKIACCSPIALFDEAADYTTAHNASC